MSDEAERPSIIPVAASRRDDARKRFGVFYTPEPVASYLVESTLNEWNGKSHELAQLRVVDPACGDGALLWPTYRQLCQRQGVTDPAGRLQLIQRQLFGVDLAPQASERLRQRFRDDLADGVCAADVEAVLQRNFRCGNAVSGYGWEETSPTADRQSDGAFHWREQFPEVCAAGGFDAIIANPPYRRERGAKADLDQLAQSPLAALHRYSRMDLWHYFFHRSLDLLRPGGILTFIVNSYWTTSRAGQSLVARLQAEATPLEFILLGTAPVFSGVGGRHLTMRLRKGITTEPCRVVTLETEQRSRVLEPRLWRELTAGDSSSSTVLTRQELFAKGQLNLQPLSRTTLPVSTTGQQHRTLGDLFEVRQGIAENPPRVTAKQAEGNSDWHTGEGVFVLTSDELRRLQLSANERRLLRPYFTAAEISKNQPVPQPQQWLLYLTKQTAPELTGLPNIERHLNRFRQLLEQRREAQQGKIAWWHLHWPREERLFEQPRVLAIQMVQEPRFKFIEQPTYVGFSINVIVERPSQAGSERSTPTLETLAVILNSKPAAAWFDAHAKRRGVNLDITGSKLKEFPLPQLSVSDCETLTQLGRRQAQIGRDSAEARALESQIDDFVTANW